MPAMVAFKPKAAIPVPAPGAGSHPSSRNPILLDNSLLIAEMGTWFDGLWVETSPPVVDEASAYIQWLDEEATILNSHEKASAVRDSSSRETLRRSLVTRLNNSKHLVLVLTATTKNDTDWVPFEIAHAIDVCQMPIIAVYPDYSSILAPAELSGYWPSALATRINNGTARVIHVPFKLPAVLDAVEQFGVSNTAYPTDGYGFYNRETQVGWGLIKP